MKYFWKFAMVILVVMLAGSTAASAQGQEFRVNNNYPYTIYFQVTNSNGTLIWPNGGTYVLNKVYHTFSINCQYGQQICWGAATSTSGEGTYWGRGVAPRFHSCTGCCYICKPGTYIGILNLNP